MLLSSTQRRIAICLALMVLAGSTLHATVYGLKSQASSASIPPTYLYKFAEDRSGFSIIAQVKVGTASIDADGLAISASKGLFAFRLTTGGSTLLKINESTGAATPIGALLAGRGIRGAVFDQSDRLLVLDARNDQIAEVNPETGALVGSPIRVMLGTSRFDVHSISDIAQRADGTFFLINGRQIFRLNVITGALTLLFRDDIASGGTPYISHAGATFSTGAGENDLFVYDINGTDDIYQYDLPLGATSRRAVHRNIVSSFNAGRGDLAALSFSVRASVPIADAGPDQSAGPSEKVALDGSGSFDPDGDYPLSYEWVIRTKPEGSAAELNSLTSPMPFFVPDRAGSYSIELVVTDARGLRSVADEVLVSTGNVPPVAIAGPDQAVVLIGTIVQLDGSGSYDADGDALTYEWTFLTRPEGSLAELGDSSASDPTFVPDVYGDYVLRLVVTDVFGRAGEDLVTVSFNNLAPTADAGVDRTVLRGETVELDGGGSSDPNGDALTYSWSFVLKPEGSAVAFTTPTEAQTSFLPDLAGDYIVSLVVHDGLLESAPSNVAIHVNTPPMAAAGPDQEVTLIGTTVQLDASGSHDADGDPLTYQWTVLTRPEGSLAELSAPSAKDPTVVPDVFGDYAVRLAVTDIHGSSDEDVLTIRFLNLAPVAQAGANLNVVAGDTVHLDGSGSSDPNGSPLFYRWAFVARPVGSTAVLNGESGVRSSFVADLAGEYIISLVVNDGLLDSAPDTVEVTVVSVQSGSSQELTGLKTTIQQLDPAVFRNGNPSSTFINKLDALLQQIKNGAYADALTKLEGDLLQKTDGCAQASAPDNSDWITDCAAQQQVYPTVVRAIELLRRLV